MSEPPAQQGRGRKLAKPQSDQQSKSRTQQDHRAPKRSRPALSQDVGQANEKEQVGIEMVSETVTEGTDGARNIEIEHVNVEVGNCFPSYEVVTTLPGNQLHVEYRQLKWVKTYESVGRVQTDVCPIAPVGTDIICIARDLTTGEEVVREYQWHSIGSALMSWLRKWLKRLFVKSEQ